MSKKVITMEEMQANPISTEELKERIKKMKEYRENIKYRLANYFFLKFHFCVKLNKPIK